MKSWKLVAGAWSASLLLAGCASIPADRGGSVATTLLEPRSSLAASIAVGDRAGDTQTEVAKILAAPVNADDVVRLALLQNSRMRVLYAELGLAQADVYDASRLSNPSLGYLRLTADGDLSKTTWSLSQSFTELLFLGYRTRVSRRQLLQTQQRVASEVLALESDVRAAYYQYVSADLVAQMRVRMATLTASSAQYAQQLYDSGNISALQLSREQAQASEATIKQRTAAAEARAAQGQLMNLLGLPLTSSAANNSPQFVVTLPMPMELTAELPNLQAWARAQRLDLAALREQAGMSSAYLTHARRWRWLGGLKVDAQRESETDTETFRGLGAELELPLFNQGGGNALRAQSNLVATQARLAALDLEIGNDMAVRHAAVQAAHANVEEYRQRLVPLRERIVALNQQEQNFMLNGAFELLAAKQEEMDTYQSYLEAVRNYWIAYTDLVRTAGGNLPAGATAAATDVSAGIDARNGSSVVINGTSKPMSGMDHSGHDMSSMPSSMQSTGGAQ